MLPTYIVGSVRVPGGVQPFVLDGATGRVAVGRYRDADPMQANMGPEEIAVSERQVRKKVVSARQVRVGAYRCPSCNTWIDVVNQPARWVVDRCDRCEAP